MKKHSQESTVLCRLLPPCRLEVKVRNASPSQPRLGGVAVTLIYSGLEEAGGKLNGWLGSFNAKLDL